MTKTETEIAKPELAKSGVTKAAVMFYKEHADFIDCFSQLKECTTQNIEELSTKIVEYVKTRTNNKEIMGYVKKRLYTGLCGKTNATRRGFSVSLIRLLRAVPELQSSAYPDMMAYTKVVGKVPQVYRSQWYIGRIFGYNILLRLGLMKNLRHELLLKVIDELVKYSRDSPYVEDLCVTTICAIYDQTEEAEVANSVWKSLPNEHVNWTPFHIGAACHFLWKDHDTYQNKTKKKITDSSLFIQKLFIRQCDGEGDTACFAWKALARYAMKDKSISWEEFWTDMKQVLTRQVNKSDFSYHAFTSIISAIPGNTHLVEDILGAEFCQQFSGWIRKKLNLYILRRVFTGFLEIDDAEFQFQLAAALIAIKDFDKRLGAPIFEQIRAKPAWKSFDFGVLTEKLVKQWVDVRKPLMEATEDEEEEIDEVEIEAKCRTIDEKLQRLCMAKEFEGTANAEWWVAGLKHILRYACFYDEAKRAKQEVSQHYPFALRGVSIINSKIKLHLPWLKDDGWKIDRIFELVDPEALFKQYGPRLVNNADPTKDFQNADAFLKMMPTMELTDVQRRLCELTVKTCRLLLITEHYEPSSKALDILVQKELTTIQDKMFEAVLALLQDRGRLSYNLALLIWKILAKTATTKQIEKLIEIASPKEEEAGDADDQDEDAGGVQESLWPVPNQGKEKSVDKDNKSLDVDELPKEKGEDDIKATKALVEQALNKDEGDQANKSTDTQENEEKGEQGSKSTDIQENEKKGEQGSKSEQNDDAKMSSSSSDEDAGAGKGPSDTDEGTDIDPPTEKDLSMLKNVAMSIYKRKHDGHRQKYIEALTPPKIMRLLEIFCDMRSGDSLVLTIIIPLLELYCGDPDGCDTARKIIIRIIKRKELPLEGVDMATMQDITDDAIQITLRSKLKSVMQWAHLYPILWLFKLYFKLAKKEEKLAEAEKWVQELYNQFWTGLIEHRVQYKAVSLPIFRDAFMRFPQLLTPMLEHVFQTVKDDKIPRPFDMFQTLCFISQAAVWRAKVVQDTFKAWHLKYAKTFCIMLPKLVKKIHKKNAMINFTKFVRILEEEERRALLKGSELEATLRKIHGEKAMRLLFLLKGD